MSSDDVMTMARRVVDLSDPCPLHARAVVVGTATLVDDPRRQHRLFDQAQKAAIRR